MKYKEKSLDRVFYYSASALGSIAVLTSKIFQGSIGIYLLILNIPFAIYIFIKTCENCGEGIFINERAFQKGIFKHFLKGGPLIVPRTCPGCGQVRW